MKGWYNLHVVFRVPLYGQEEKLADIYHLHETIYKKLKAKYSLSKYDTLIRFGIISYLRPIKYKEMKFYPMYALDSLNTSWTSNLTNSNTNLKMMTPMDVNTFAYQLVNNPDTLYILDMYWQISFNPSIRFFFVHVFFRWLQ